MGCRCKERQAAILRANTAAKDGDAAKVAKELEFVVASSIEDAGNVFRQSVAAARSRLSGRR